MGGKARTCPNKSGLLRKALSGLPTLFLCLSGRWPGVDLPGEMYQRGNANLYLKNIHRFSTATMTSLKRKISASRRYFCGFQTKKVFVYLFCFSALFLAFSFAGATTEDLDTYSNGNLGGQGDWITISGYSSGQVNGTQYHSSPKSVYYKENQYWGNYLPFASSTESVFSFWVNAKGVPWWEWTNVFLAATSTEGRLPGFHFECWNNNCASDGKINVYATKSNVNIGVDSGTFIGHITPGVWTQVEVDYDFAIDRARFWVNGATDGIWYDMDPFPQDYYGSLAIYDIRQATWADADVGLYFDDFFWGYSPISGYWPVISPTWPVDCQFNATDTFAGSATGNIEVPLDNPDTWTKISITFKDRYTEEITTASTTISLTAGQKYTYSIPYSLASSTYSVDYFLDGYECSDPYTCSDVGLWYGCPDTGLGIFAIPYAPDILSPPAAPSTEDCSGYDLLERLVCEIKNFVSGIFIPSPNKVSELRTNIEMVKGKAPYTYLLATKEFLIDLNGVISTSTPSVPFSMFGATGTIDFTIFEATTTFAGLTPSFSDFVRFFFVILIVFKLLIPWYLSFLRKIFK